jgi:hypothetical protein
VLNTVPAQDLQLPPAFALPEDERLSTAIARAYERDFSHIPVLDGHRRPLGYIDVAALKAKWEAGAADPVPSLFLGVLRALTRRTQDGRVGEHMTKFERSAARNPYKLMTPATPLADLEAFLGRNLFALGACRAVDSSRPELIVARSHG